MKNAWCPNKNFAIVHMNSSIIWLFPHVESSWVAFSPIALLHFPRFPRLLTQLYVCFVFSRQTAKMKINKRFSLESLFPADGLPFNPLLSLKISQNKILIKNFSFIYFCFALLFVLPFVPHTHTHTHAQLK